MTRSRAFSYLLFLLAAGWPVLLYEVVPHQYTVALAGVCLVNGLAVGIWAQTRWRR